jgi:hypothetical protein
MRNAALALISGDKTSAQEKTEQEPLDLSNEDETELLY